MLNPAERKSKAVELFHEGYNCAQAVVLTFEDILPYDRDSLARLASSFGGGMGRLREVCGAYSSMFVIAGLLYGYSTPETGDIKAEHYARIQKLAFELKGRRGSLICRDILGLSEGPDNPVPAARTAEYYDKRPCADIAGDAAEIMAEYINEYPAE